MSEVCSLFDERLAEVGGEGVAFDPSLVEHAESCATCAAALATFRDGDASAAASVSSEVSSADATETGSLEAASAPASSAEEEPPTWYAAIGDEEVGPLTVAQLETHWNEQTINADTQVWKPGMAEWADLGEVSDLAYLMTKYPQMSAPQGSWGAQSQLEQAAPAAVTASVTPDPLRRQTLGGGGGTESSWRPSGAQDLAALAREELVVTQPESSEAAPAPATPEGMPTGLPSLGGERLFPDESWRMPSRRIAPPRTGLRPIHVVLAGLGTVSVAAAVVVAVLLVSKPPAQPIPQPAPRQQAAQPAQPVPAAPTAPPPVATAQPAQVEEQAPEGSRARGGRRGERGRHGRKGAGKRKRKGEASARADPAPAPVAAAAAKPDRRLTKDDILGGVRKYVKTLSPCFRRARSAAEIPAGKHRFVLNWVIQESGRVSSPKMTGPPSALGTSLPRCIEAAMTRWRFPASSKSTPITNFPLPLSL